MKLKPRRMNMVKKKSAAIDLAALEQMDNGRGPSSSSKGRRMHQIFLNADVIILICVLLDTTLDRLSFYGTSRWCSSVLKNVIHTDTILRPDGPTIALLSMFLREPSRRAGIVCLDVRFSLRTSFYVPGRDDLAQLWRKREDFVYGVRTLLERVPNLKSLHFKFEHDEKSLYHCLSLGRPKFPFTLQSCRLAGPTHHSLNFIDSQAELTRLVLAESSENHPAQLPDWAQGFTSSNKLRPLWATPGWARTLLVRSPVQTFGLIRDSRKVQSGWGWNGDMVIFNRMAETFAGMGGHPTVRYLALPAREFYFVGTLMELKTVSDGFPNVEKLGITLEPRDYDNSSNSLITNVPAQIEYAEREGPTFQSAREFSLLLPGTWPREDFGTSPPYSVGSFGLNDDRDFDLLVELLKIMPRLVHVDTISRCYSRVGAGVDGCDPDRVFGSEISKGEESGGICSLKNVWFGRPRNERCLSDDWSQF
ncbi:hypothetical protein RhiJN_12132 [Ceratobasidium sp. AG-Ba]|nr:hypothetical protein RhiJN_12132 [Ceratobasidium sp. AG-Ba]QRW12746.1 hypothetical protein RhiLY_11745 [Ceratobasidium sp. AG-Ba]